MTKVIIFDSGILINLSMNGLLYIIPELKKISDVRFIVTKDVQYETIERPLKVPRFELGALRVKTLLDEKQIESSENIGIKESEIKPEKDRLMKIANHSVMTGGSWVNIVSDAEISCLALSTILTKNRINNLIAIDERTTRILSEKPKNLEKIMAKKLHQNVKIKVTDFKDFDNFKFIRSTEMVYVAYKKGVLHLKDPRVLEAVLYATKYKGSSVSFEEIQILKKL